MSAAVDVAGILERAGADPGAAEGTQAWALAQVDAVVTELIDATDDLTANLFSITKAGIRTPLSTRQAATRAHAALARIRGAA